MTERGPVHPSRKRLSHRYPLEVALRFLDPALVGALMTVDVSDFGAYVSSKEFIPVNQLVRAEVDLPDGLTIEVLAFVKHHTTRDEEHPRRPTGMGLEFFFVNTDTENLWREVVKKLSETCEPIEEEH